MPETTAADRVLAYLAKPPASEDVETVRLDELLRALARLPEAAVAGLFSEFGLGPTPRLRDTSAMLTHLRGRLRDRREEVWREQGVSVGRSGRGWASLAGRAQRGAAAE